MTSLKDVLFTENDIIDPFWVIRYLENHISREQISSELLIKTLKKMLRHIKGAKITFRRYRGARDIFIINGCYDKEKKKSIEIEICSSALKKKFDLDKQLFRSIIYDIADTFCHESLHRYQFKFKDDSNILNRDGTPEQDYYGDPDEMFCFSVNIAHNIYRQYGKSAYTELQNLKEIIKFDPYLYDYYSHFYNQRECKKVIKMVYQNLKAIDEGRICHRPLLCSLV